MYAPNRLIFLLIVLIINTLQAQDKKFQIHTVAFYNVENLFDTIRDVAIYDEEWTPKGAQSWSSKKYNQKVQNLARVIAQIGTDENKNAPTLLGLSEIENKGVIQDLVDSEYLKKLDYGIIHFDSPDKRGIDVGLIYQKKSFTPTSTASIPLYIQDLSKTNKYTGKKGVRVYTRDQLLVSGLLDGEEIHIIVNHWPSRSGGEKRSSPFREAAAALNKKTIDSLQTINPNAKVITMGDLNDGPYNKSLKKVLGAVGDRNKVEPLGIFNPMEQMAKQGLGTLAYRDAWDIFDQILVTEPLVQKDYDSYRLWKASIYKKPFMTTSTGPYKGYPLRNANGEVGFSDHFPVYIYLIKELK